MRKFNLSSRLFFALALGVTMSIAASAQTLTNLHSFNGTDGMFPQREWLVQGADGNFYGTTENGGVDDYGVVFKMTPDGTVTLVHDFVGSDGEYPMSGLIQDAAGNLYGTTRTGGPGPAPGVVYKITPQGAFSIVTGGAGGVIYAPLLLASDGKLYGVSYGGGTGWGSVFRVGTDGSNLTVLYSFCAQPNCADGGHPIAGLVEGPDHNFYGVTTYGGSLGDYGVVFRITPSGAYTVLHNFNANAEGNSPRGKLLYASNGYLYGTTNQGGAGGGGTVFRIGLDGSNFGVVLAFCSHFCGNGSGPESGLMEASDGNFYGTTAASGAHNLGTIYRLTPSGQITDLYNFCNCGDGSNPVADLLLASDGFFYGTTTYGGANSGGTVFKFTGPPIIVTSTTLTTSPNPSHEGQPVTMTATVQTQNGLAPTGNVLFYSDGAQIGAGILSGGVAVLSYSGLALGTHNVVAVYQGGGGFAGSTSNTVQQVVQLPLSTTTVTSTPNPSIGGQQVTITATVGPAGPPQPTGTVGFTSNGSAISGCTAVVLNSGTAVCITSALPVGTDAVMASYSGDGNYSPSSGTVIQIVNPVASPLQFVAIAPCRIVDTRNPNGSFGGPAIPGNTSRAFPLAEGDNPCGVPANAAAYSLNVTVVPQSRLGYLTIWPSGEGQPTVSTLNSLDGRVKANAVIVPAGAPSGAVSVYVTNTTNVILDINGYFIPANGSTLEFYPVTPCRVADTRAPNGPLGGPPLVGGHERDFPVVTSNCGLPANAAAYSMNFTVVPPNGAAVGYLTVWPQGSARPTVSTLNDPTGTIVANAAIIPAGSGGGIATYATDNTNLIIDVNGYFAAPANGGLSFYALTPCRAVDTRQIGNGQPFRGELTLPVQTSPCGPPASARGYVFNATVVPQGSFGYLTLWPDPLQQPTVSTLNALDGTITSNMAIVPNQDGKTDAYASDYTQLIMDISGYFAP